MTEHASPQHPDLSPASRPPFMIGLRVFLEGEHIGTIEEVSWDQTIMDWVAAVVDPHGIVELLSGDDWFRNDTLLAGQRYHASLDDAVQGA